MSSEAPVKRVRDWCGIARRRNKTAKHPLTSFGEFLENARLKARLRHVDLQRLAGVHRDTYLYSITGGTPWLSSIVMLADTLGISGDAVFAAWREYMREHGFHVRKYKPHKPGDKRRCGNRLANGT